MRHVAEYELTRAPGPQLIRMPRGAELFGVSLRGSTLHLWALLYERAADVHRALYVYETAQDIPDTDSVFGYVGSDRQGATTRHVFDGGELEIDD